MRAPSPAWSNRTVLRVVVKKEVIIFSNLHVHLQPDGDLLLQLERHSVEEESDGNQYRRRDKATNRKH